MAFKKFVLSFILLGWSTIGVAGQSFSLPVLHAPEVTLTLTSIADNLSIETPFDAMVSLTTSPHEYVVAQPFQLEQTHGFVALDAFEVSSEVIAGARLTQWRYQMTLDAVGPWRIDPFVLVLENTQTKVTREVLVQGVIFPPPCSLPTADGTPQLAAQPVHVAFSWSDAWLWLKAHVWWFVVGLLLGAFVVVWKVWLCRILKERTLPPEKRAAIEFQRLQAQQLIEHGDFKRYFYELTAVVRRYFERAYALRATRQTTQEFLQALATLGMLDATTDDVMRRFLQTADRVKFAGETASRDLAVDATQEAHALIDKDTYYRYHRAKKVSEDAHE